MLSVSNDTILAYKDDGSFKNMRIYLPELNVTIGNDQIEKETFSLEEKLLSNDTLEFVGCNASSMRVTIYDNKNKLKNKKIQVFVTSDDTDEIPLFEGYIDSIETVLESTKKTITAYDAIYSKTADKDVASWYNSLRFPATIKTIRDSLMAYVGIEQESTTLPNDSITVNKEYEPSELNALDVIKNICQLNGVFGIVNRYGKFEYRVPGTSSIGLFPSINTHPSLDETHPGRPGGGRGATHLGFYEKLYFEEYSVNNIAVVKIRENADDESQVSVGSGINTYIVEGNIFAYNLDISVKERIARNILDNVNEFSYIPFNCDINGVPYMEVGDLISLYIYDGRTGETISRDFSILNRSYTGNQFLRDNLYAEGDENQKVFVSNLNTNIKALEKEFDNYYDKDEIDNMFEEAEGGYAIKSVEKLPDYPDIKTLYLIQGEVIVI